MNYANPTIADTLLIALVGFTVVFMVLVVLMGLIKLMSIAIGTTGQKKPLNVAPMTETPAAPTGVRLENVSDREAAMIMAIVADKMQVDPARLNFISIKEVKEL